MKRLFVIAAALLLSTGAFACTSVIITGKATRDGRPLMWKNTDGAGGWSSQILSYHEDGKYPWIGLAAEKNPTTAWFGTNSTGFCVMNTKSHNFLTEEQTSKANNGYLMRKALDVCVTLQDFLNMLDTITMPKIYVCSHYGVIDAQGAAAYVEFSYDRKEKKYWVVDVNDPVVAPYGYLTYTNWSRYGVEGGGGGYIRQESANEIVQKASKTKEFTPYWIFNALSRSFYNAFTGEDLRAMVDGGRDIPGTGFHPDNDFIPRFGTSVASVIQGVKPGEDPQFTTLWTALGYPPTSIATPAWVKGGKEGLNSYIRRNPANRNGAAEICNISLRLKSQVFPIKRGNGKKYFNFKQLYNVDGTGFMQQLAPAELEIWNLTQGYIEKWRKEGEVSVSDIMEHNRRAEEIISEIPLVKNLEWEYKHLI